MGSIVSCPRAVNAMEGNLYGEPEGIFGQCFLARNKLHRTTETVVLQAPLCLSIGV